MFGDMDKGEAGIYLDGLGGGWRLIRVCWHGLMRWLRGEFGCFDGMWLVVIFKGGIKMLIRGA